MEGRSCAGRAFRTAVRTAAERESEYGWDDLAAALEDDFSTPARSRFSTTGAPQVRSSSTAGSDLRARSRGGRAAPDGVRELADARQAARASRDWEEADRLRRQIEEAGWEVQGARRLPPVPRA